ncbi:MAG: hypothetical protein JXA33_23870 [Anaerolineae bacterium]|nr:hypothetical protein [Anaerolineae bacterium]
MWHPPSITRANLRFILRAAPAGAEIVVPPGEFEGPFIFDHPLTLRGYSDDPRATTLWTRRGPALIVRSPGVSLTNLNVELTWEEEGRQVTVGYAAGCYPHLQNASIQGHIQQMGISQEAGWRLPDLIDLGDLRARHSVRLPLVVEVPAQARVWGELAHLQVQPELLPAAGEYLLHVGIAGEHISSDTFLAGQLVFEAQSEIHPVWVIGRVVEEAAFAGWVSDTLVLIGAGGHKFGFGEGMVLGPAQFRLERGADALAEKQAYILKDSSGAWSIIQPAPVPTPTLVDGQSLDVGRRWLLKGGERLQVGKFAMRVEVQPADLPVVVDACVDFGKLSAREAGVPVSFTVRKTQKRGTWTGTLRSTVPWIEVPQPAVTCRGGETVQVAVRLSDDVARLLPQQLLTYPGALMLEGARESWAISARVDVDVLEIPAHLQVLTPQLEFVVEDRAVLPQVEVRVQNTGTETWSGTASSVLPWLAVTPEQVVCPPEDEATVTVILQPTVDDYLKSPGSVEVADAVRLVGHGQQLEIGARLSLRAAPPPRLPDSLAVDFGTLDTAGSLSTRELRFANTSSTQSLRGTACSTLPWLTVTPSTFDCSPGQDVVLRLSLTGDVARLSAKSYVIPDALILESGRHRRKVSVRLDVVGDLTAVSSRRAASTPVVTPRQEKQRSRGAEEQGSRGAEERGRLFGSGGAETVDAEDVQGALVVDFGRVSEGMSGMARELRLPNPSQRGVLRGLVRSTLPWLSVTPTSFSSSPGDGVVLTLTLTDELQRLRPKVYQIEDALVVEIEGKRKREIGVQLEVVSPSVGVASGSQITTPVQKSEAQTDIEVPALSFPDGIDLDFGVVSEGMFPLPVRELHLTHQRAISGTVRSTLPWLSVIPASFSCKPGKTCVLKTTLEDVGTRLRPKVYEVPDALVIEAAGQSYPVAVRLEVVREFARVRSALQPQPVAQAMSPSQVTAMGELYVDFGVMTPGIATLPTHKLNVPNPSAVPSAVGTARSTLPWLVVAPAKFSWKPGQVVVLELTLTGRVSVLRAKTYKIPDAVVVECAGERYPIGVRLTIT